MKRVFGMAKSPLDLRGGKGRNLELDFLRLVYAVEHCRTSDLEEAQGYLLVITTGILSTVGGWVQKYDAADCVKILNAPLTAEDMDSLRREKAENAAGIVRS
jgi:hypothetical protein